jgi:hypothetical protein
MLIGSSCILITSDKENWLFFKCPFLWLVEQCCGYSLSCLDSMVSSCKWEEKGTVPL